MNRHNSAPVIIPETDPLAWVRPDPSAGYVAQQRILLRLDPQRYREHDHPSLWVVTRCQAERGTPAPVWHGRWLEWELPPRTDAAAFTAAIINGEADPWLSAIAAGHRVVWDGSNLVGQFTEEALAACAGLAQWLAHAPELAGEAAGLWDAADWLQPGEVTVTPDMDDAALDRLAEEIETAARVEFDAVIVGTRDYLASLRDQARAGASHAW